MSPISQRKVTTVAAISALVAITTSLLVVFVDLSPEWFFGASLLGGMATAIWVARDLVAKRGSPHSSAEDPLALEERHAAPPELEAAVVALTHRIEAVRADLADNRDHAAELAAELANIDSRLAATPAPPALALNARARRHRAEERRLRQLRASLERRHRATEHKLARGSEALERAIYRQALFRRLAEEKLSIELPRSSGAQLPEQPE